MQDKFLVVIMSAVVMASSFLLPAQTAHAHSTDSLVKTSDGTIYFIESSYKGVQKRPFTSFGAFQSYGFVSLDRVVDADTEDFNYTTGEFIPPQDGEIFCATQTKGSDVAGECSLITNGMKAAFTSAEVFAQQGFSFNRAFYGDSSFLEKTDNISNGAAAHRSGTLIDIDGTIYYSLGEGLLGIPTMEVFNSWGWGFGRVVVPANSADRSLENLGELLPRQQGAITELDFNLNELGEAVLLVIVTEEYPDYPTNVYQSVSEKAALEQAYREYENMNTYREFYDSLTLYSQFIMDQMPLFANVIAGNSDDIIDVGSESFAIYGDGTFGIVTAEVVDDGEEYLAELYFLKENGRWRWDFIATLKSEINNN